MALNKFVFSSWLDKKKFCVVTLEYNLKKK